MFVVLLLRLQYSNNYMHTVLLKTKQYSYVNSYWK